MRSSPLPPPFRMGKEALPLGFEYEMGGRWLLGSDSGPKPKSGPVRAAVAVACLPALCNLCPSLLLSGTITPGVHENWPLPSQSPVAQHQLWGAAARPGRGHAAMCSVP